MRTNETINHRIQEVIDRIYDHSVNKCASALEVSPSVISGYTGKRKSKPSYDVLEKMVAIANISPEWLLTGRGEMIKSDTPIYQSTVNEATTPYNKTQIKDIALQPLHHPKYIEGILDEQFIPLLSFEATAGVVEMLDTSPQYIIDKIYVPNSPKCDGAIRVTGDSMYPLLKSGDIVAFKKIYDLKNIHYGDMYIVFIDEDGDRYITVKWLHKNADNTDTLTLISHNPNYAPRDVHMSAIRDLALVKFSIRYNTMY